MNNLILLTDENMNLFADELDTVPEIVNGFFIWCNRVYLPLRRVTVAPSLN